MNVHDPQLHIGVEVLDTRMVRLPLRSQVTCLACGTNRNYAEMMVIYVNRVLALRCS